ncbi:helix-turn-helix domain-containing protein [Nocardia sp. NPDC051030]|uniref:TetR/AcrR family transcriptional regulator n=1 Tax=Nocardia sp. NPDC051030 TaxID=3155162 RepID=UPI003429B7F6
MSTTESRPATVRSVGVGRAVSALRTLIEMGAGSRPPEALDPLLDATVRAVAAHGFVRTSMSDLARELGVTRKTLYRQVSSVEQAILLVVERSTYAFLDDVSSSLSAGKGPEQVLLESGGRWVSGWQEHPFTRRLLEHEPEVLGSLFTTGLIVEGVQRIADRLAPMMPLIAPGPIQENGDSRRRAEWLVRTLVSLIMLPTDDDLDAVVTLAIAPILR